MIDPIDTILRNEGSQYTNNPLDKGGPTKYGITLATLSQYRGHSCTPQDVMNLQESEAHDIYTQIYLVKPHIIDLPEPSKTHVLDIDVNSGDREAGLLLQRAINQVSGADIVTVDGIIGPGTIAACVQAQDTYGAAFQNALVDLRIAFYERIVAAKPDQIEFLQGWKNRANSFRMA